MDYSFLKLYDSISESISDDLFKTSQIQYYTMVQLLPSEIYLQTTNYDGDLSLSNDFSCYVVDNCDNILDDITSNVFVDEYVDSNGFTQSKIEYVNLGVDYGGRAVHIKFKANASDVAYYTRPIKITEKDKLKTYRFDYSNPLNLEGISYEAADCFQSIRLMLKFIGFSNKTEVSDYYQISSGNNISLRPLRQMARNFITENIDSFTFVRLQELLLHNEIYIDLERITNKPILEYDDRLGESNLFRSNFTANVNGLDTYTVEPQIYDGLQADVYFPSGLYVTGTTFPIFTVQFNEDITLNTGTMSVYNDAGTLIASFTEADATIVVGFILQFDTSGSAIEAPANDVYYVHLTGGFVTGLVSGNEAVNDDTTWTFELRDGDYSNLDYTSSYFTD